MHTTVRASAVVLAILAFPIVFGIVTTARTVRRKARFAGQHPRATAGMVAVWGLMILTTLTVAA